MYRVEVHELLHKSPTVPGVPNVYIISSPWGLDSFSQINVIADFFFSFYFSGLTHS